MTADKQSKDFIPLCIEAEQEQLLERLSNASGVSGDEGEIRTIVLEQVRDYLKSSGQTGEVKVDALGSVLVHLPGSGETPRLKVMLAAHMDEVGLMVTRGDGKGFYRFETVGGIDPRQLPGKTVRVGKKHVAGVIGTKPIHLMEKDEASQLIKVESMRIDVGLGSSEVKEGDRAVFATNFQRLGPSLCGKALDDRLGVAILLELVKHAPENIDLCAAFTVQEEIGGRGARVAAYAFNPDLAIVLDSTPANDLPVWDRSENAAYNTKLGGGPAIYLADSATLSDPRLTRHLEDTAESLGIPYQIRQPGGGGTDAGAIHRQRAGIPSVSVSVPGRYAHTAAGIARLSDSQNTLNLVKAALECLPADILQQRSVA